MKWFTLKKLFSVLEIWVRKLYLLEIEIYTFTNIEKYNVIVKWNGYKGEADLIDGAVSIGATADSSSTSGVTAVTSGVFTASSLTEFTDRSDFAWTTLLAEICDVDVVTEPSDFTEPPQGGASPVAEWTDGAFDNETSACVAEVADCVISDLTDVTDLAEVEGFTSDDLADVTEMADLFDFVDKADFTDVTDFANVAETADSADFTGEADFVEAVDLVADTDLVTQVTDETGITDLTDVADLTGDAALAVDFDDNVDFVDTADLAVFTDIADDASFACDAWDLTDITDLAAGSDFIDVPGFANGISTGVSTTEIDDFTESAADLTWVDEVGDGETSGMSCSSWPSSCSISSTFSTLSRKIFSNVVSAKSAVASAVGSTTTMENCSLLCWEWTFLVSKINPNGIGIKNQT